MRDIDIVVATSGVTLAAVGAWAGYVLARARAPWAEPRAQLPSTDAGTISREDGATGEVAAGASTPEQSPEPRGDELGDGPPSASDHSP